MGLLLFALALAILTSVSTGQALFLYGVAVLLGGGIYGFITYAWGGDSPGAWQSARSVWIVFGVVPGVCYALWHYGIAPLWHSLA